MTEPADPDTAGLSKLLEGFVAAPIDAALRSRLSEKPDWFDDELNRILAGQSDVGIDVQALTKLVKRTNRELSDAMAEQARRLDEARLLIDTIAVAQASCREEMLAGHAEVMRQASILREAVSSVRRMQIVLAPGIGIAAVVLIEIIHHLR